MVAHATGQRPDACISRSALRLGVNDPRSAGKTPRRLYSVQMPGGP